jgi:predicted glutamine amidotransferase
MCRWLFYYGKEVCVSNLLYGADHALARQSENAGYTPEVEHNEERNNEVNVHGCGIGWYASNPAGLVDELGLTAYSRPTVYTTVSQPLHDRNLRRLSKNVETSLLFGHVRAAGPGAAVHEYNTHPFCMGRYLFMHNGGLARFQRTRRKLLSYLRDDLFDLISGTTDSELLFALILNSLPDICSLQPANAVLDAVRKAFELVVNETEGAPSSLNIALSDGETVIATRFRNGEGETPPSLYYHLGPVPGEKAWDLSDVGGWSKGSTQSSARRTPQGCFSRCPATRAGKRQAILVASEPLSVPGHSSQECPSGWRKFPANSMLTVRIAQQGNSSAEDRQHLRRDMLNDTATEPAKWMVVDCIFENLDKLAGRDASPSSSGSPPEVCLGLN